ncbi:MAG TPA: biopolymer transporter ExbD [Vicinamibacterales bacterium]|nr:biopolymer transporter ExbD [Vicinamibacterales bacterium]
MAMQLGGSTGIKSDINVTPLVDVMLVLLIIMMIVAPLLQQGIPLTLPLAVNSVEKPETAGQTVVAVNAQGKFYVGQKEVRKDDLGDAVRSLLETKKEKVVIIKGDRAAQYGAVMEAMDQLRKAGIEDMGLITGTKAAARGGE